ncbi:MAG: right-handed parallel beta-helix repeat-containing protein [Actinomycetaceae bacterium]|nr:right-handed parallel beta-helix repeat-containing protein [Actinomycetaceae bacterium]
MNRVAKKNYSALWTGLLVTSVLVTGGLAPQQALADTGTTYYVDCSLVAAGDGSRSAPFSSVGEVNAQRYTPGDHILFKSGTQCSGSLQPQGSGTHSQPIVIDKWHDGNNPVIQASTDRHADPAIVLFNQSGWVIRNIDLKGGYWQTLSIMADEPGVFSSYVIENVTVSSNAWQPAFDQWMTGSGGIVIQPCSDKTTLKDITVDSVTSHHNHITGIQLGYHHHQPYDEKGDASSGMSIPGCNMDIPLDKPQPKTGIMDAKIMHSSSHDNDASGIQVFGATNVLIRGNELYRNGSGSTTTIANPTGMNGEGAWWDTTDHVTAEYNNAWGNREGKTGDDGSGLDADRMTTNSLIQYNYLHDNANYGVSVIAGGADSTGIIRYNIMANNGRKFSDAPDVMISRPYPQGQVSNYAVVNNTMVRDWGGQGIRFQAAFDPDANIYAYNNMIARQGASEFISSTSNAMKFDRNLFFTTTGSQYYRFNNIRYSSLSSYQLWSGQDRSSVYKNPFYVLPTSDSYSQPIWPDYSLKSISPMIKAGIDSDVTHVPDYYGRIAEDVSIGAIH